MEGIRFYVNPKYTEKARGDFCRLPAGTIDLLLQFMYPGRNPDISSLEVDTLCELADAAEKYEVYNAMSLCESQMRLALAKDPVKVMAYAIKYNRVALADQAGPLMLGTALATIADTIPSHGLVAWIHYITAWEEHRIKWTDSLLRSVRSRSEATSKGKPHANCHMCKVIFSLLGELKRQMITHERLQAFSPSQVIPSGICLQCKCDGLDTFFEQALSEYGKFRKFSTFLEGK